jgi:hypothetical protein
MKTYQIVLFWTIILVICIVFSCNPENEIIPEEPPKDVTFEIDEFPLAVGNKYRYSVIETGTRYVDTLTMEIIDSKEGEFYVNLQRWKIFGGKQDSALFKLSSNEISYKGLNTQTNYSFFSDFKLKFPMKVGSKWVQSFPGDTIRVISIADSIVYFDRKYFDVFFLKRIYVDNALGIRLIQTLEIKPGIGILKQSFYLIEEGQVPRQDAFFLIDADLK